MGARRAIDLAPPPELRLHRREQERLSHEESALVAELFEPTGINPRDYRPDTLRRRIPACLRAIRVASAHEARRAIQDDPDLIPPALSALIIGVTSFFRDAAVFDHLTYHVLPDLARRAAPPRIWSAACSDGAELYSVAILLAELRLLQRAQLLGTDIRNDALVRARNGIYEPSALKDVPDSWLNTYFQRHALDWRICHRLATTAHFRRANLLNATEPGCWDLILCRNIGMYLRPEVAGRLWTRLEESLAPGGYLILGKAERPTGTRLVPLAPCIYRRDRG